MAFAGIFSYNSPIVKKKQSNAKQISNRRVRFDYDVGESLVVGMMLSGAETKALRRGQGHIRGAYVVVKGDELWLINATITGDGSVRVVEEDHTRSRKLLAKRKEIAQLIAAKQQGLSIVPLEVLTRGRYVKLRIASARGKKKYDKREVIKKRDQERQNDRELAKHNTR